MFRIQVHAYVSSSLVLAHSPSEELDRASLPMSAPPVDAAPSKPAAPPPRPDDASLTVGEDAKRFAASLQGEILARVQRESAQLDHLFAADELR